MSSRENILEHSTVEDIKSSGIPVIIFGSGVVGEALFQAGIATGLEIECFCDNNINKTKHLLFDKTICHTGDLNSKYPDAHFLISAADIQDVVSQLHSLNYDRWYPCSLLLREFDVSKYKFAAPYFAEYAIGTCLLCHDCYLNPDRLFLRSVDIVITERCSLKCRDCSNLMQYYHEPVDYKQSEIIRMIDAFCNIVDEVNEFRVIGGEPFMNREFHLTVQRLADEAKVKKIIIYTNGTIVPQAHQLAPLKNSKVLVFISDYGPLSGNLAKLVAVLQAHEIAYFVRPAQGWTDCAGILKHQRGVTEHIDIFRKCCARNLATLSAGQLFRCPFAANASKLKAVPDFKNDYIDLLAPSSHDVLEMKNQIRSFLIDKDFLETCDYCNGRPFDAPEIKPAVQTYVPLKYDLIHNSDHSGRLL
jgi:hypothetical protein